MNTMKMFRTLLALWRGQGGKEGQTNETQEKKDD